MKRDNLKFVALAAVCLTLSGFPMAHAAVGKLVNADTVDGKHAVSSTASTTARKGKLVATSKKTGRLPNNIIAKAPKAKVAGNALKLGGQPAAAYLLSGGTAANSTLLDGHAADDFLSVDGIAADSQKLGGFDVAHFLGIGDTAANAAKLGGLDASQFLGVGGTAADSAKLGGFDVSHFLPTGALQTTFSTIAGGNGVGTIFSDAGTAPALKFTCAALGSSIAVQYPTGTTGLSTIFWDGANGLLQSVIGTLQNLSFALPLATTGGGHSSYSWHDAAGVWTVNVSYTYNAGPNTCSVLTQTVHSS